MRPLLPRRTREASPSINDASNLALVFHRYGGPIAGEDTTREAAQKHFVEQVNKAAPSGRCLGTEAKRRLDGARCQTAALARHIGGEARRFSTVSQLVTGLGLPSPLENGMELHPTLGVPYLPASGLKGLALHWARSWTEPEADETSLTHVFGTPERIGSVIFFDALPHGDVRIEEDVMTPHYQEYHQSRGDVEAPADWLSPNPIPFFVVPPGQQFTIALAPRPVADGTSSDALANAWRWLEEALLVLGFGAKTKAGYGRLERRQNLD